MTGKTTRLVDSAIHFLFTDGVIFVPKHGDIRPERGSIEAKVFIDPDHHNANFAQTHFRMVLLRRLVAEHQGFYEVSGDYIKAQKQ